MSSLNKDGTSIYDHFNESDPLSVTIDMDELALKLETGNYGTVRFFAALIRVRKKLLAERIKGYRDRGHLDIALSAKATEDPIVEALEKLLVQGEF